MSDDLDETLEYHAEEEEMEDHPPYETHGREESVRESTPAPTRPPFPPSAPQGRAGARRREGEGAQEGEGFLPDLHEKSSKELEE